MWPQEFIWFFAIFYQEFRQGNGIAFEVLMMLAFAHFFGFYNPKQLADFLGIPHQKFYTELKHWSVYQLKKMLLRFQQLPLYPKDPIRPMSAGSRGAHCVPQESRLTPPAHRESKQGMVLWNFCPPLG